VGRRARAEAGRRLCRLSMLGDPSLGAHQASPLLQAVAGAVMSASPRAETRSLQGRVQGGASGGNAGRAQLVVFSHGVLVDSTVGVPSFCRGQATGRVHLDDGAWSFGARSFAICCRLCPASLCLCLCLK
jgi:hypothetical protein